MKKIIYIFGLMIFFVGCNSIAAKGRYRSIPTNNSKKNKKGKSNGNAFGYKNPKNPHYNGVNSNKIDILF